MVDVARIRSHAAKVDGLAWLDDPSFVAQVIARHYEPDVRAVLSRPYRIWDCHAELRTESVLAMVAEAPAPHVLVGLEGERFAVHGAIAALLELAEEVSLARFGITDESGSFMIQVFPGCIAVRGGVAHARSLPKDLGLAAGFGVFVLVVAAAANWVATPPGYTWSWFGSDALRQGLVAILLIVSVVATLVALFLLRRARPGLQMDRVRLAGGLVVTLAAALGLAGLLAAAVAELTQPSGLGF